ncbi:MAG: acyltransferase [Chloroflexi bacterium]|nr:MAG: acyltransferase [Chloroflexota bacterium]MBL1197253.1 acyltransferase [Chloroflexota bacterium]NOH14546.1 acyltransferase [Chloroflexota bacterium]
MKLGAFLRWELVRWLFVGLSGIPGGLGIGIRYLILRWFIGESHGPFRILERVTIEYPKGLNIGRGSGLNYGTWVNARGGVTIGDNVIIGPYCLIHSANHQMDNLKVPIQQQGFEEKEVLIGNNVWLGARVTVLPGVTIGDNAVIGAGAVVTKDIPPDAIAVGNPANVQRLRSDA